MADPPYRLDDLSARSFERILLIKPSSLGDVIHALPVLAALRHRYPDARIDWLVSSAFASLLEQHPDIHELIRFDRKRFGRLAMSPGVAADFIRFVRDLRRRKYDLVLDLQGLFRSGFLARASGAKVRMGFSNAREGASLFYTHRIPAGEPNRHAVDRNMDAARLLGYGGDAVEFNLAVSTAERDAAEKLLGDQVSGQVPCDKRLLVLVAPGARWETKRWPPSKFAQLIDHIHQASNVRCVLVGGPDEITLCQRIADECRSSPGNLSGRTTLRHLAAVVERASVVLCQDSAVMHLAVAVGRPLVCLVGPTNPARTGPYGRQDAVVRLELDCSPCYFRRLTQCTHDHRCMAELGVDRVVEAVRHELGVCGPVGS